MQEFLLQPFVDDGGDLIWSCLWSLWTTLSGSPCPTAHHIAVLADAG